MSRRPIALLGPCVACLVATMPSEARAAPCSDLPNPTIGLAASAGVPLLERFSTELAGMDEPVSLVIQSTTSCFSVTAYIDETPMTGSGTFWDADGVETMCELPLEGVMPDWGMLSIDPLLCEG